MYKLICVVILFACICIEFTALSGLEWWGHNDLKHHLAETKARDETFATGYIQKPDQGPLCDSFFRVMPAGIYTSWQPNHKHWFPGNFDAIGLARGITLEEAIRIANDNPDISYFSYGKCVDISPWTNSYPSRYFIAATYFYYGNAVFFSGPVPDGPIPDSQHNNSYFVDLPYFDSYVKTGNPEDVVSLGNPIPYNMPPPPPLPPWYSNGYP